MIETKTISRQDRILGGLWGSLTGDALGVPVEFMCRAAVQANPVTDMRGFGTHHQPKGTWSDDGALLLCSVDSLVNHEFDTQDMGNRFLRWMDEGLWTATGEVFDIGNTTSRALSMIAMGTPAEEAGGRDDFSNGNGSLMRIIPVAVRFADTPPGSFMDRVERSSAITHGHARARMACAFFALMIGKLLRGLKPQAALDGARPEFAAAYESSPEFAHFRPLLEDDFTSLPGEKIKSTGYVLHTLHASLWCLLTTNSFRDCVLKAVNLGGDTDTTGCVAGGLAGIAYGKHSLPPDWVEALPRKMEVESLFERFATVCQHDFP